VARGRELYLQNCALCHGTRADGRGVRQSGLVGKPVDFTSRAWRTRASRKQTEQVIRDGKQGTSMAAWKTLGDVAIRDLTSYVLSVSGGPR
jgi:high-affinity iron transporter